MIPDYETYECAFEFGIAPTAEDEAEARNGEQLLLICFDLA